MRPRAACARAPLCVRGRDPSRYPSTFEIRAVGRTHDEFKHCGPPAGRSGLGRGQLERRSSQGRGHSGRRAGTDGERTHPGRAGRCARVDRTQVARSSHPDGRHVRPVTARESLGDAPRVARAGRDRGPGRAGLAPALEQPRASERGQTVRRRVLPRPERRALPRRTLLHRASPPPPDPHASPSHPLFFQCDDALRTTAPTALRARTHHFPSRPPLLTFPSPPKTSPPGRFRVHHRGREHPPSRGRPLSPRRRRRGGFLRFRPRVAHASPRRGRPHQLRRARHLPSPTRSVRRPTRHRDFHGRPAHRRRGRPRGCPRHPQQGFELTLATPRRCQARHVHAQLHPRTSRRRRPGRRPRRRRRAALLSRRFHHRQRSVPPRGSRRVPRRHRRVRTQSGVIAAPDAPEGARRRRRRRDAVPNLGEGERRKTNRH